MTKHRALIVLLVLLAFACGVSAAGWRYQHLRADCWKDLAEEGLVPEGKCDQLKWP